MKRILKITALSVLLLMAFMLFSCNFGDAVTYEEATAAISNVFGALGEENYEEAASFMHPNAESSAEKMKNMAETLESLDISFSNKIEVKQITSMAQSVYDSYYGGSSYSLTFVAAFGEKNCTVEAIVVRNAHGFGVHELNFSPN